MSSTTTRTRAARKETATRATVAPAASADPPSREGRECRDGDSTVQSLTRALQLIELLSDDDEGYRLVDLAARSGLSTSTVHRLLTTLEQRQFVQFDRERSLWYVGVRCFSVGAAFARRRRISELALPVMQRLSALSGETINLGVASDGQIVFACQVEGRHGSRALARPGQRAPLHGTAMGQAVLAAKSEPDVLQYLRTFGLPRLTDNTIARPSRLHETLAEVRRRGYAVDDEQNALGLCCIAAAIYDEHGRPFAAVSLAGSSQRIVRARFDELGAWVRWAAAEISAAYGGRCTPVPCPQPMSAVSLPFHAGASESY
ncbi:IclR family transcriptional regulator [Cupriavidus necator]